MKNNIQKAFAQKAKRGLRMASGGVLGQLDNQIAQNDAISSMSNTDRYKMQMAANPDMMSKGYKPSVITPGSAAQVQQLDTQNSALTSLRDSVASTLPASQPAGVAQPTSALTTPKPTTFAQDSNARSARISDLGSSLRKMQAAAPAAGKEMGSSMYTKPLGLRAGGVVDPEQGEMYDIEGPGDGSGTDDKVAVNVHGKNIKVSKGEKFAVFPASIPAENIEEFIESQTGEPSATARGGLREGMKARGGFVDDFGTLNEPNKFQGGSNLTTLQQQIAKAAPEAQLAPTGQTAVSRAANPVVSTPTAASAPASAPAPAPSSYAQGVKTAWAAGNPNVGEAVSAGAKSVANSPAAQFVGRNAVRAGKLAGKAVVPIAALGDAAGIVDVATDDDMGKADVAEQVGRTAGKWGSAAVGAKGAAALAAPFAPLAGPLAPAVPVVAGLAGGAAGYFGSDALMDAGSGHSAPARRSNGVVEQTIGNAMPKNNYTAVDSDAGAKIRAANEAVINAAWNQGGAKAPQTQPAVSAQDDLQSRSLASEAVRSAAQQAAGINTASSFADQNARAGLRSIASNEGVREAFNAAHAVQGDGIQYKTTMDPYGKPQVLITGGAPTKDQYIGADGKGTNDWTKTAAYGDGVKRAEQDKLSLRNLQYQNALSSVDSPNEEYQQRGLRTVGSLLARDNMEATKATKGAELALQSARLNADLRKEQRDIERDARDHGDKRGDHASKTIDEQIKIMSTVDGKLDPAKYAMLTKWESKFGVDNPHRQKDPNRYLQQMLLSLQDEQLLQDRGEHLLTPEKNPDGSFTKVRKAAPSLKTVLQPSNWFGQVYEDTNNQGLRFTLPSMTDEQLTRFNEERLQGADGLTEIERRSLRAAAR